MGSPVFLARGPHRPCGRATTRKYVEAMAKISKDEARTRWRDAESAYLATVEEYLDKNPTPLTKDAAVAITKRRIRADRRMDEYFHRCLGEDHPRA